MNPNFDLHEAESKIREVLDLPFDRELKAQFTDASGAVQSADIKTPKAAKEGEELTPIEIELYAE